MYLNRTTMAHAGIYICRLPNYVEHEMHLTVTICRQRPWNVAHIVAIVIVVIALVFIFIMANAVARRLRRAMQLRNSERIYIMKRVVLKEVIKNPDYLSTQIDSELEIGRDRIDISGDKLGEGNFGVVYRGLLDSREVAIKMASDRGQSMLVDEVRMMHHLGFHRHVLELIGVCHYEGSCDVSVAVLTWCWDFYNRGGPVPGYLKVPFGEGWLSRSFGFLSME